MRAAATITAISLACHGDLQAGRGVEMLRREKKEVQGCSDLSMPPQGSWRLANWKEAFYVISLGSIFDFPWLVLSQRKRGQRIQALALINCLDHSRPVAADVVMGFQGWLLQRFVSGFVVISSLAVVRLYTSLSLCKNIESFVNHSKYKTIIMW